MGIYLSIVTNKETISIQYNFKPWTYNFFVWNYRPIFALIPIVAIIGKKWFLNSFVTHHQSFHLEFLLVFFARLFCECDSKMTLNEIDWSVQSIIVTDAIIYK